MCIGQMFSCDVTFAAATRLHIDHCFQMFIGHEQPVQLGCAWLQCAINHARSSLHYTHACLIMLWLLRLAGLKICAC